MTKSDRPARIFNTPLEVGVRSLIILEAGYPWQLDLQGMIAANHLLVHSGDIQGGFYPV